MSIVKSLSVGNGDMFYIKHDSDNFTIIDCCIYPGDESEIIPELEGAAADKRIHRFISTHPDEDHMRGLGDLNKTMPIRNFYCVENSATKDDESEDFKEYCRLRDSDKAFFIYAGCQRKWMNLNSDERTAAGIYILWPDTTNEYYLEALEEAKDGFSPNNISPIIQYRHDGGARVVWMGDLENDFMINISDAIELEHASIVFAPHHGRDSGKIPTSLLDQLSPNLIIVGEAPSEHLHYYPDYNTITQNSAGDITLECVSGYIDIYVANEGYSVDFLEDRVLPNTYGHYLGSLKL